MKKQLLSVLAFVVATFVTQAASHFGVNAAHYAAVAHLREQPIFPLGVLAMLIQGGVLAHLYPRVAGSRRSMSEALKFAGLAGAFLLSYTALAEAAKYSVPAVAPWIAVEAAAGFVQFLFYGLLLGLIHR
jgi:hypothetical protein